MRLRHALWSYTGQGPVAPLVLLFGLNAVDELDRSAFGILLPEIRDAFGLDNQSILSVVGAAGVVALGAQVLIGYYADRMNRVRIASAGAAIWALFTLLTGLAPAVAVLVVARSLSGMGQAVNDPTHNSLLADYYPPAARVRVYGLHRAANSVGQIAGPLLAGLLALVAGWRAPFLAFCVPTLVLVVLAWRMLAEPPRGGQERRVAGGEADVVELEEPPPTFGEAWRICYQVRTLRRLWLSLPLFGVSLVGIVSLTALLYEDVFGVGELGRGVIAAATQPFQLVGLAVGIPLGTRLAARDPGLVLKLLAVAGSFSAVAFVGLALAPSLPVAIAMNMLVAAALGTLTPGLYASLSQAIPPRARSLGFGLGSLFVIPGLALLGIIGAMADAHGIRVALLLMTPIFLLWSLIVGSAGRFMAGDVHNVRATTLAQAEVLAARRRGESKLLLVRGLDVGYDGTQVLFGVDLEVDEGEIIALLGTNGAGKSTLLRAISGLLAPSAGAVVFDGRDLTHASAQEVVQRGIVQVPGGKGIFPGLSVAENLRIAGWLFQRDKAYLDAAIESVLETFPVLRERWTQPAATLSGGEQQMLTLAQAFIAKPRLLLIDELSLGLAPAIVAQLLDVVRAIRARGTTVILVEQSVNVALTVADDAYFMEKGEIRFHGPTAELLGRPDILRSVFLEGAAATGAAPVVSRDGRTATPGGTPPLEVRGLRRSFGGIVAVDDVSFVLDEHQILGIIGPNGAGKTTLFDLISGFLTPDAGTVLVDGRDVTELSAPARARVGLGRSFQEARLFPALTVSETLAVALEGRVQVRDPVAAALNLPSVADSEAAIQRSVDELIEVMGLGAFRDKFVSELSTGSRRIVDLACIVAQRPRVLLLDEPSSGIAQRETEALGPVLVAVREQLGLSLLVIEHDMPLITSISDQLLALHLGAAVTQGAPSTVVGDPDVVASYLGTEAGVIGRSEAGPLGSRPEPATTQRRS